MSNRRPTPALSEEGRQAVALLRRYPALNTAERETLKALSARLGFDDVGHIWRDSGLAGRMMAFYDDHIDDLARPPRRFMMAIAGSAVLLGLLLSLPEWLA